MRRVLCWLTHLYIRLVYWTNRWTVERSDVPRRLRAEGKPFILAFWHGRLGMIPMAWQRLAPMHMLISAHRDGRIIADVVKHFGVDSITGSSRRGGTAAVRTMLRRLAEGDCVGITPDGPWGPAMTVSGGMLSVAQRARVPIVPIVFSTSRGRILDTWDRFFVAHPFGRGVYIWGEPIEVPDDLDQGGLERMRRVVESRMIEMTREADRRVGRDPRASTVAVAGRPRKLASGKRR